VAVRRLIANSLTSIKCAVSHLIPGIEGDCGGFCPYGTCHVYIADEFVPLCNSADELESRMLKFASPWANGM